jgi:hypothetical protein
MEFSDPSIIIECHQHIGNKSELIPLGHSKVEIYTHNFSPGIKITTDKFKLLGIIIPTNGKQIK